MQELTFHDDADPAKVAKVQERIALARKPRCMRCGKIQTTRQDIATRVCHDRSACTTRSICSFRAPKGMALKSARLEHC